MLTNKQLENIDRDISTGYGISSERARQLLHHIAELTEEHDGTVFLKDIAESLLNKATRANMALKGQIAGEKISTPATLEILTVGSVVQSADGRVVYLCVNELDGGRLYWLQAGSAGLVTTETVFRRTGGGTILKVG